MWKIYLIAPHPNLSKNNTKQIISSQIHSKLSRIKHTYHIFKHNLCRWSATPQSQQCSINGLEEIIEMNSWHSTAWYIWREGPEGDCWCLDTNEKMMSTYHMTHPSYISVTWHAMCWCARVFVIFLMHFYTLSFTYSFLISHMTWSMNQVLQKPQQLTWDQPARLVRFAAVCLSRKRTLHCVYSVWSPYGKYVPEWTQPFAFS